MSDQYAPEIDSFVDSLNLPTEEEGGSAPDSEVAQDGIASQEAPVAPESDAAPEDSSLAAGLPDASPDGAPVPEPSPDPALTARLEQLESQAREASERAARSEALIQQAQERAMQQQEQARQAQLREYFTAQAMQIEQITDPTMQKQAAARLVAEVEMAQQAQARQVIQEREQQIAQRDQEAESSAAIGAAMFQAIQNHPALTPAQKQELIDNARHYAMYPNPAAQQAAIQREQKIVQDALAKAKAEWEKATAATAQARVQNRIASDTDLVGTNAAPGGKPQSPDAFVDSLFR